MKQLYTPEGFTTEDYRDVASTVDSTIERLFSEFSDVEPRQLAFLITSSAFATQAFKSISLGVERYREERKNKQPDTDR